MTSLLANSPFASQIIKILRRLLIILAIPTIVVLWTWLASGEFHLYFNWVFTILFPLRCAQEIVGVLRSSIGVIIEAFQITDIGRIITDPRIGLPALFLFSIIAHRRYEGWRQQHVRNNHHPRLREWARKTLSSNDGESLDFIVGAISRGLQQCSMLWYQYTLSCIIGLVVGFLTKVSVEMRCEDDCVECMEHQRRIHRVVTIILFIVLKLW